MNRDKITENIFKISTNIKEKFEKTSETMEGFSFVTSVNVIQVFNFRHRFRKQTVI
jgi:hypothetical protein